MKKVFSYLRHNYQFIYKIFLVVLTILILVSFFPKEGKFKFEFSRGKPWQHDDLIAPYDFAILKSDKEIEEETKLIKREVLPYYVFNHEAYVQSISDYESVFESTWEEQFSGSYPDEIRKRYKSMGYSILDTILQRGVVMKEALDQQKNVSRAILVKNNVAEEIAKESLFTLRTAYLEIKSFLDTSSLKEKNFLISVLENSLLPTVTYNAELTRSEIDEKISRISITRGLIQEGERIISRGELVSPEKYQILESLKKTYESKLGRSSAYALILSGQIALVTIALMALFLYIYFFRKDIFSESRSLVLILLVIIITVLITSFTTTYYPDYIYLIPICMAPIIIRAFFDSTIGLFVLLIAVIIVGFIVPNSFEFIFLQLIAGIVTVISVVKLHRRSQFFLTSILIFLTYSLIYIGLSLIHEGSIELIETRNFVLFAGNAILTLFAYPLIYLFEKIFGNITDVTLMELSDTNSRLLRELTSKAPGTFQHSLQVANIAEDVIYEIGGNALLVRTGALYHDIGKMDMPLHFIENQTAGVNPHDDLTYEESARIIINHVIRGVEKAKKSNLPEQIIDFIRTHHGTRKAEYFYIKQKEQFPDEQFDEELFTYRGPIPFSRETAVLLMADSVEAASRSLQAPDENKINNLVDKIIDSQMNQGQLNNADLTLKEISIIKRILKKKLMSIYHLRIEYPEE